MKSKTSLFKALFKENIKRFWLLSFAGSIIYFLSGPFRILSGYGSLSYYDIANAILDMNIGYCFAACLLSVFASAMVFSYLNNSGSTSMVHALPFTRKMLFAANYLSGFVIAVLPAAATALILIICKQPVTDRFDVLRTDIYTVSAVLICLLKQLIIIFYSYTICVLASMLCGNSIIQVLTGTGFNLLIPFLYLTNELYCEQYLYGYSCLNLLEDYICKTHPLLWFFNDDGTYFGYIVFPAFALLILVFSYLLYTKRKLERSGQSYVFKAAEGFISLLLIYFSTSGIAFIFSDSLGIASYVLGFVLGFVISEMIVRKTMRIFNKESLRPLAAAFLVIFLIVCSYGFDILGIEKILPDTDDINEAYINCYSIDIDSNLVLKSKENIEAVRGIHRQMIDFKDYYIEKYEEYYDPDYYNADGMPYDVLDDPIYFTISYKLKNGRFIAREYNIPANELIQTSEFAAICASDEFNSFIDEISKFDVSRLTIDWSNVRGYYEQKDIIDYDPDVTSVVENDSENGFYVIFLTNDQKQQLLDTLCEELKSLSLEDRIRNNRDSKASLYLRYSRSIEEALTLKQDYKDMELFGHYLSQNYNNAGDVTGYEECYSFLLGQGTEKTLELINKYTDAK